MSLEIANAAIKRSKRGFVGAGLALFAGIPAAIAVAAATGVFPLGIVAVHCILFGLMSLSYGIHSTKNARFDQGALRIDETSVALGGELLARRDELAQAFVVPTDAGILVRLDRKGPKPALYVRVNDEGEARSVLEALGFDAKHAAAEMRIASGLLAMPIPKQILTVLAPIALFVPAMFAVALGAPRSGGGAVFALVLLLMTYMFGVAFAPTNVRIGTDGLVTKWLGRRRYVAFADIASVERYSERVGGKQQRGVRLTLEDGETLRLPVGQTDIGDVESARLASRIEEARDAHRAGSAAHPADLLVRGARTGIDWVRALRRLGAGVADLRSAAVPRDVLLGLVEDSAAPAIDRASAAVAALSGGDPEIMRRVRVAAETTAEPKLRVALDRIAEVAEADDEAALAETLDALERAAR